uniref:Uncharacterized protein n=1 Tax=Moniliophthora roreri TaxID=221103 RepID=A0A0W0FTW9_MONRR
MQNFNLGKGLVN